MGIDAGGYLVWQAIFRHIPFISTVNWLPFSMLFLKVISNEGFSFEAKPQLLFFAVN